VVQNQDKDRLIIRYLLGDLPDDEQVRLEEEYFGDEDFFGQMLAVEDELIDAYAQGGLSARERELFEKHFLLSETRRRRLEFARLLDESMATAQAAEIKRTRAPEPVSWWQSSLAFLRAQNPVVQFAPVAVLLLFIALALFSVMRWRSSSERQPTLAKQETNQEQGTQPGGKVEQPGVNVPLNQNSKGLLPATLMLVPGSMRGAGGEAHTLTIPADAERALLQIVLEEDSYGLYRALVRKVQGQDVIVWKDYALKSQLADADNRAINLEMPARLLSAGDYKVRLEGVNGDQKIETVADYNFRVVRK
jgi:hypothetical protein